MNDLLFQSYIQSKLGQPFNWGTNDCNTLALEVYDFFCHTDYAKDVIGQYNSQKSAYKFGKKYGTLRDYLPMKQIQEGFAQTGDFILIRENFFDRAHICLGNGKMATVIEEIGTVTTTEVRGDVFRWTQWQQ